MSPSQEIFLSYKFTGEDPILLEKMLGKIKGLLEASGYGVFCSLYLEPYFKKQNMTSDEIYDFCLNKLETSDIFFAFLHSEIESKGMKMELQKAQEMGKKIVVLIQKQLIFDDFVRPATQVIEFDTIAEVDRILLI